MSSALNDDPSSNGTRLAEFREAVDRTEAYEGAPDRFGGLELLEASPSESRNGNGFPPQIRVQELGAGTVRRHFLVALFRWCALLVADLALLLVLRTAIELLRQSPVWTPALDFFYPGGFLGGAYSVGAILLGLVFARAYGPGESWNSSRRVFWGAGIGVGIASWQFLPEVGAAVTLSRWVATVIPLGVILVGWRGLLKWLASHYVQRFGTTKRVILVGSPSHPDGRRVVRALEGSRHRYEIGWLTEDARSEARLGHPSRVWEALAEAHADLVILCGELEENVFSTVVEASFVAGCRVLAVPLNSRLSKLDPRPTRVHGLDVTELTYPSLNGGQKVIKRFVDVFVAAAGLVLVSPLLAVIAVAIRLDSPGSVIFKQKRVGFAGNVFEMLKFRTMRCGADEEKDGVAHLNCTGDSRLFKIPDDPRVTRVGRFLRRWSLDELPQLINVIRGDMSLIGPRPFFPDDLRDYRDHHFMRLAAKPGITGMWQVFGRSDIVDFEEVVRLDCEYINRWSLGLDLEILARTVPAVIRRDGAY